MFDDKLQKNLFQRQQKSLYRVRVPREDYLAHAGILSFCSNDYLGLSNDNRLKSVLKQSVDELGVGSGSSQFLIGFSKAQQELEHELAEFIGVEKAVIFSNGYLANLGAISGLCGRGDTVFLDRLSHASMIDGVKLSGATLVRYKHNDSAHVQQQASSVEGRKLIVTESVFGMDGDIADIPGLMLAATATGACLMIDDAHGFGVIGKQGRGIASHCGIHSKDIDIIMGTFGKALGVVGAFVAGRKTLIDALLQFARPLIYNTGLPPALFPVITKALRIVQAGDELRERLCVLIDTFRCYAKAAGLALLPSTTPVQVVLIGDATMAETRGAELRKHGVLVSVIRPPTVPPNTSRLRISMTAKHTVEDIKRLVDSLCRVSMQ